MVDPADLRIIIRPGAFGVASAVVRLCHPNEIGGILIGYRSEQGVIVVDALHVPSDMRPTKYERSHHLASVVLDTYFDSIDADSPVGYIGEWHSHPSVHSASSQDLIELADIASSTSSLIGLLIFGADPTEISPFAYLCDASGVPWPVDALRMEPAAAAAGSAPAEALQPAHADSPALDVGPRHRLATPWASGAAVVVGLATLVAIVKRGRLGCRGRWI